MVKYMNEKSKNDKKLFHEEHRIKFDDKYEATSIREYFYN